MSKMMKKKKTVDAVDRISELPEHLQQRILSSLPFKHAVRTTVLCKRWKNAWITAFTTLKFGHAFFKEEGLWNFVEQTLRIRHSQMNVIVPKELRNSLLPPLYNFKSLTLEYNEEMLSEAVDEIVDGVVWFSSHPVTCNHASAQNISFEDINDMPPNPNQQPSNPRLEPKSKVKIVPFEEYLSLNKMTIEGQFQV